MKRIEVVAAIIIHINRMLCVQRGSNKYDYISKKFELPGGKIKKSETYRTALIREIKEVLQMDIETEKAFMTVDDQYPDFHLTMHSYYCS